MAKLSPFPASQALDNNGDPLAYGKAYTFTAGTSTPKETYTSQDELNSLSNPIILDENGRSEVWLGDGAYKIRLYDQNDNFIDELDNVSGDIVGNFLGTIYEITANTTINQPYQNSFLSCLGTVELSLLAAVEAGEGFAFKVSNDGVGIVTITPDGAETPVTSLGIGDWAEYVCDGTNWKVTTNTIKSSNNTLTGNNTFSGSTTLTGAATFSNDVVFTGDVRFVFGGELTITSGSVIAASVSHTIDTESDAATDDLDTISGGTDGQILQLRAANANREIVVKDGVGNIETPNGVDILLDNTEKTITLIYDLNLTKWIVTSDTATEKGKLFHIQDQKPSGVNGGTFTAGSPVTRDLNTVVKNEIVGASLDVTTGVFTLPANTYDLEFSAPAHEVDRHQATLYNETDLSVEYAGSPERSRNSFFNSNKSDGFKRITLTTPKTFSIRHECSVTKSATGFGQGASFGNVETYTEVKIWTV